MRFLGIPKPMPTYGTMGQTLRQSVSRLLWSADYERLATDEDDDEDYLDSQALNPLGTSVSHRGSSAEFPKEFEDEPHPGSPFLDGNLAAKRRRDGGSTFQDSGLAGEAFKPISGFEGAHRYDPTFEWHESEEKRLVRRVDYRICTWVCFMFFAMQLDRGNIGQALADNMLDDLNLSTNEFNNGTSIFFFCFLCAELPSQVIGKWLGPDRWIPIQMVTWSILASMQAFLTGKWSFYLFRALLGMMEGGFVPDIILYMSYWYTSKELPTRLSYFWMSFQATYIASAFLAYGILHMRGVWGMAGWRWLFGLEGIGTCMIGILSYYYLPASPTQTASAFRGEEGWFSEREEKILVNRILRDDPSKGDMHNRQALTLSMLWAGLSDYDLWPIYLLGLTWLVPQYPVGQYLTLQLRETFDPFMTNLLCIPAYLVFIAHLLLWTWVSEQINERLLLCLVNVAWVLPLLITMELLPADAGMWTRWLLTILIVGGPYVHAIIVAVTSRNSGSVRTRTVSSAIYNMCVQASSIFASHIYREDDKPSHYSRGNRVIIAICCYNAVAFVAAKVYYVRKNRQRVKRWRAMTKAQRRDYVRTTKDVGNKRLDFRFTH